LRKVAGAMHINSEEIVLFDKHQNKLPMIIVYVALLLILVILISILLDRFIFTVSQNPPKGIITEGYELNSKEEGFSQRVIEISGDRALVDLKIAPHAEGPPKHMHITFDESFTVRSGSLTVWLNTEKKVLKAGETVSIPKGMPHKLFNETEEEVALEPGYLPVLFLAHLSHLYKTMDELETMNSPKIMFQLAASGNNFDTWIADGPPLVVQKIMRTVLSPWARLMGYKRW
jgi:mannose-6-phosphate isomerase-like protein (cupin superfamily)